MLILTRRCGEVLKIGDDIEVVPLKVTVNGHIIDNVQVSLGVKAPKHVSVDRLEIWERKRANKK